MTGQKQGKFKFGKKGEKDAKNLIKNVKINKKQYKFRAFSLNLTQSRLEWPKKGVFWGQNLPQNDVKTLKYSLFC